MATKPTTAPEQAPTIEGLPINIFSTIIHENIAAAAAVLVVIKALIATPLAASADPALKPNQPKP